MAGIKKKRPNIKARKFDTTEVVNSLTKLAGQDPIALGDRKPLENFLHNNTNGLGYSQFNEVLLLLGYDRVKPQFFDFLCLGRLNPKADSKLKDGAQLQKGVERFRKLALFAYGNVKFGYKRLSSDAEALQDWLDILTPVSEVRHTNRLFPAFAPKDIEPKNRYFLGYVVEREIRDALSEDPDNATAKAQLLTREKIVKIGTENQISYLTSDYLDVYVATSMRERHEYLSVADITNQIFNNKEVKPLNLRWFDPTLAYCGNRIDKGLAEALMLKRAKCTLFLAQESDTLGKDSELACTLSQGKPVVAYVPNGSSTYVDALIRTLQTAYPGTPKKTLILKQLRYFDPALAWDNPKVRSWLEDPEKVTDTELVKFFKVLVRKHYDKRAQTLKDIHPLGIQVHLETGVAMGVLVVREIATCAKLLRRIMLGDYRFSLSEEMTDNRPSHLAIREELSKSIFRVMTYDKSLTHTFWNFYLH